MKQYDIYTTTGGTYSTKPRPAVVIQAVSFDDFDSLTVIPITTIEIESDFRIKIEPSDHNNLDKAGYIMIDKITTIKQSNIGEYIGHIDEKYVDNIKSALYKFIGI
ncbi:MAG: type II toxin-antitoxin system PemK/MazF family toxin [Treponema sp.]|nr:type II toxin-antitoxin system PemK/MazF family toxin [Treponema sp.]